MLKNSFSKNKLEAGCDEAGRGCLAGPVVAAAVIWPKKLIIPEINDSKKLSAKKRQILKTIIIEKAIAYGIGEVSPQEIDQINILNASFLAMHRALDLLNVDAELLLIDGNRFNNYRDYKHECIIGGDGKYTSIAAASILAKTYRDELMEGYHESFPEYGWNTNKGYATLKHRQAILKYNLTYHHRKTFCQKILNK